MTSTDGRVLAWASAWQILESAQRWRLATFEDNRPLEQLPPQYYAMLQEVDLLVQMSKADPTVGFLAGAWYDNQIEARIQAEGMRSASAFEAFLGKRADEQKKDDLPEDPGPICACEWSRRDCKMHPWPPEGET